MRTYLGCLVTSKFQSTLPRGSDYCNCHSLPLLLDFNPRSLAGATLVSEKVNSTFKFQSTLPRGSDSLLIIYCYYYKDFNPRSLAGATLFWSVASTETDDFNPRSLAGAT